MSTTKGSSGLLRRYSVEAVGMLLVFAVVVTGVMLLTLIDETTAEKLPVPGNCYVIDVSERSLFGEDYVSEFIACETDTFDE